MPANFTEADIQARVREMAGTMVTEQTQALKDELKQERDRTARLEAATRRAEFAGFCDGLVVEGKLTPAQKGKALDLMEVLHGAGEFDFAEGGKKGALDEFRAFLSGLPKQIEFSEIARKGRASSGQGADAERDRKVQDYMEHHQGATYKDAVLAVSADNPELFRDR